MAHTIATCAQSFAGVGQIGASSAVNCQTHLLKYADALKEIVAPRGNTASLDAAKNAVQELLGRFKQFGACEHALNNALSLPKGGSDRSSRNAKAKAYTPTQPTAVAPSIAGAKRVQATKVAASSRAAKTLKKRQLDDAFVRDDDAGESESDDEYQPDPEAAIEEAAIEAEDSDNLDDDDEEVPAVLLVLEPLSPII
jgi:hypothetical protein